MTKRNQKTYEYRGESFPSLMSLADKFSVNYWNLIRRIKSGWTIQQAMGDSPKPIRKAHNSFELKTSIGTFNSIRDASSATGIAQGTLAKRLRMGWSPDEAIGINRHKTRNAGNKVVCEGREFLSVFHFADHYNKSRTRTHKRLASGWTPEEAVGVAPRPPRFRNQEGAARDHMWTDVQLTDTGAVLPKTEIGNYRLYSIREKSTRREYVGITTGDLKARLRGHWRMVKIGRKSKLYNRMRKALAQGRKKDFEIMLLRNDARDFVELQEQEINAIRERGTIEMGFNTGKGGSIGTSKQIKISQMVFPSHQAAADHFQIDSYKFSIRLNRLGWSPEEAAGLTGRGAKSREVTVDGKRFKSLGQAVKHYNMQYGVVHSRIWRDGWTLEQALGIEQRSIKRTAHNRAPLNTSIGKFASISEAAIATGIKPATIARRLRVGWTPDEAVGAKKRSN